MFLLVLFTPSCSSWRKILTFIFTIFSLSEITTPHSKAKKDSPSLGIASTLTCSDKSILASKVETLICYNHKVFSFSELRAAANNFRSDSLLGEGGFGCVYKGWISEDTLGPTKPGTGIVVAIKKLKPESFQGHKEWLVCPFLNPNISYLYFASLCFDAQLIFDVNKRILLLDTAGRSQLSGSAAPWKSRKAHWLLLRVAE